MKHIVALSFVVLLALTGCQGPAAENTYQQITQEKAKKMMESQEVLILDVREQEEFDAGQSPVRFCCL